MPSEIYNLGIVRVGYINPGEIDVLLNGQGENMDINIYQLDGAGNPTTSSPIISIHPDGTITTQGSIILTKEGISVTTLTTSGNATVGGTLAITGTATAAPSATAGDVAVLGTTSDTLNPDFLGLTVANATIGALQTQQLPTPQTLAGTTAGDIYVYEPVNASGQLKSIFLSVVGYENDTATAQTITYSVPFTTSNVYIFNNTTGLTVSTTADALTITAPDAVTVFNGGILIIGI